MCIHISISFDLICVAQISLLEFYCRLDLTDLFTHLVGMKYILHVSEVLTNFLIFNCKNLLIDWIPIEDVEMAYYVRCFTM